MKSVRIAARESGPSGRSALADVVPAVVVGLPLLWVSGIHVNDLARILVPLLLVLGLVHRQVRKVPFPEGKIVRSLLSLFVLAFVFFTASQPILEAYLGRPSIDFAIFSQVVDSISRRGAPMTSLIGMEWRNFLSHHFAPFLYVPGLLSSLGIPAPVSVSLVHCASVALSGLALGLTARRVFHFSTTFSWLAVTLLYANPTFRHGVLFGVHDELYALPFIGFAYLSWLQDRPRLAAVLLLGATLCKENLFLVVAAFGAMATLDLRARQTSGRGGGAQAAPTAGIKDQLLYGAMVAYGLAGFFSYVYLQPFLMGRAFDHADKLANLAELTRLDWLGAKAWFVFLLGLPFLGYPLWKRASWHLLLPALPLIGLVLVSRFDEMWKPFNYYGILPTYSSGFASLIAFGRSRSDRSPARIPAYTLALLIAVAFCWSGKKPARQIAGAFGASFVTPAQLSFIPEDAKVIAGPAGALMLLRTAIVWRLWSANRTPPEAFDFIVTLPEEELEIGTVLRERSEPCAETGPWRIRCRRGGRYDLRQWQFPPSAAH